MVYVLGATLGHNATAAISKNGEIIACVSEERFSRKKNHFGYPERAIKFCLEYGKISSSDIDLVVLASHITPPLISEGGDIREESRNDKSMSWFTMLSKIRSSMQKAKTLEKESYTRLAPMFAQLTNKKRVEMISNMLNIDASKIISAEHHLLHALSGVYSSGITDRDLLVVTVDGEGDMTSSTVGTYKNGEYMKIASSSFADSIGHFYSAVTKYLGMKMLEHEYKVMGLAPYAWNEKAEQVYEKLKKYLWIDGLTIKSKVHSHRFLEVLEDEMRGVRFDYVAAGAQLLTERLLCTLVENAIKETDIHDLVLSGGVFMNVKANQEILKSKNVNSMYIMPSCGDESLPIGCCYYGTKILRPELKLKPINDLYLGPEYSDNDVKNALLKSEFKFRFCKDSMAKEIAKLLAKGEIVARCSGRMEFGARALGNRSILADASDPGIVERINKTIKMRDFWMPFAPVMLEEQAYKYIKEFEMLSKTRPHYMMITFDSTKQAQKDLVAAMHPYDKTLRPQLINRQTNPEYYAILTEFGKLTGRYGIVNTSFNIHGEPIVCSPEDALHTLKNSELKYLALGSYLVYK